MLVSATAVACGHPKPLLSPQGQRDDVALRVTIVVNDVTASAIAANLYRLSGFMPETTYGHFVRVCVLMFAGPSEMFESAVTARMSRDTSAVLFWLTISAVCYWSSVLGMVVYLAVKRLGA
jgi:hypothetical protein